MRTFPHCLITLLALIATLPAQAAPVQVAQGQLEGTEEQGMRVFRGIPFAAPPVGALRWREPQPAATWAGVRKAEREIARAGVDLRRRLRRRPHLRSDV
jgi:hypothetical protein